jgi:hypothetical protein
MFIFCSFPFSHRHPHCSLFRPDYHRPVAHPAHHIDRLLRLAPQCQLLQVRLHPFFHHLAHLLLDRKKTIRRTHPVYPLMRPLMVVIFYPPGDPFPRRLERVELRTAQELLPDRLPEPLDFPKRLGVVGLAAKMMDPVLLQFMLESRLSPPVRVLPPIVRQHFLGHPILTRASTVDLQHVLRRLTAV